MTKKRQFLFGLSDHFPGSGIPNYRLERDWSFWGILLEIDVIGTMSTPITALMVGPKISILP